MNFGISLHWRDLPTELIERHRLQDRVIERNQGGEREIRFFFRDRCPLIPAWWDAQLGIYPWGGRESGLPRLGWIANETLDNWRELVPQEVEIPATFGFDRGIWYAIREGLRGVVVLDKHSRPHIYLLTQPASHYYQVMTRNSRMPIFVGNQI